MTYFKKNGYTHELTKEAKALHFKVETTVSAETIENIIVSSLEGASAYWCGLDNTTPEWYNEPEELPTSQYATQLLLEGKSIKLYDIEDEGEEWELDLKKILKGIGKAISEGYDIEDDVDEVLQIALFGELVYG
jgi:hypothetical protein